MPYIQLPSGKIKYKKEMKMKLSNITRNHNTSVLFPKLNHVVRYCETKLQQKLIRNIKNDKYLRDYSMSISEVGQLAQKNNNLQVTVGMLNYPYEIFFKDKSKFVRLNSIIGSLLQKLDGIKLNGKTVEE